MAFSTPTPPKNNLSSFGWLKEAIDKIEAKMDTLDTKMDEQTLILTKHTHILEDHKVRHELGEKELKNLSQRLRPFESIMETIRLIGRVTAYTSVCISILAAIAKLLEVLLGAS